MQNFFPEKDWLIDWMNEFNIYRNFLLQFQVLELQNTLDDLTSRVDAVKVRILGTKFTDIHY